MDMAEYNYAYKRVGNYKGLEVHEVSLADYITLFLANEAHDDIYYVITENLNVVNKGWVVGSITSNRRTILDKKHVSVRVAFGTEIKRRTPAPIAQKMVNGISGSLITARPTIAHLVKEGERKLKEQRGQSRKLIEELTKSSGDA